MSNVDLKLDFQEVFMKYINMSQEDLKKLLATEKEKYNEYLNMNDTR